MSNYEIEWLIKTYLNDLSDDIDLIDEAISTLENYFNIPNVQITRQLGVSYLALKEAKERLGKEK